MLYKVTGAGQWSQCVCVCVCVCVCGVVWCGVVCVCVCVCVCGGGGSEFSGAWGKRGGGQGREGVQLQLREFSLG